jgi:PhoH-like ATPase
MAAGLKRTVQDREFRRLVVARPTISMGKELGFLPGSLEEKLAPWMQPIHDALEMLGDLNMGHDHRRSGDLMRSGSIVVEALSYIRGRSIANQFMIIDEAQNLTPLEVKTIVTRVGNGTKIVFTGDPYQIDNPYVDSASNGFNYVVSRFRDQAIAAHIELQKGERSELAELAANIFMPVLLRLMSQDVPMTNPLAAFSPVAAGFWLAAGFREIRLGFALLGALTTTLLWLANWLMTAGGGCCSTMN